MSDQPKDRNEVNHDAIAAAVNRLQVLLGGGATIVLVASWANGPDDTESDQCSCGNYFAQEGMVREWLARREAKRTHHG